jgi:aryl-alcohol dehydrogenase-like predicted oxidoreductase
MKYRRLGKTDLKVSTIGVGTWQFGGEWGVDFTPDLVKDILDNAIELGINLIDTAECYGDHLSESLIGSWLQHQQRDQVYIATKFGHFFNHFLNRTDDFSVQGLKKQFNDSLKALKTDYIDLLQFHSGSSEQFNNNELWETVYRLKQDGKIRHFGISINSRNPFDQVQAARLNKAETIQVVYNRLSREPEKEILPECIKQNLGVLARVPLASGILSGKYNSEVTFLHNDARSQRDQKVIKNQINEVEQIKKNELPSGIPLAQYALAWCLKHDAVSCVIPGCKSVEQIQSNAKAADIEIK